MEIDSKKRRIGVDIDDVIVGFMKHYLIFHNVKHNTNFNLEDITNYHLWEIGLSKSRKENAKEVLEFQNSPAFEEVELLEGAKEGLEKISRNHIIYFITSRPDMLANKTKIFLDKHFPKNGFNVLYSGEIYGGKLSKAEICKNFQIPKIIEDNPDYALNCAKEGIKVFLLDKPWNRNYEKHENIERVRGWKEIGEILL